MAESIDIRLPEDQNEGTVSTIAGWFKNIGDTVAAHEPLVEIETDKVNTEVASPATGVLSEIIAEVGVQVNPGDLLGRLSVGAPAAAHKSPDSPEAPKQAAAPVKAEAAQAEAEPAEGDRRHLLSPSVRRLASEHNLDLAPVKGTGRGGRITRRDVVNYLEHHRQPAGAVMSPKPAPAPAPVHRTGGIPSTMVPHDTMRRRIADHMVESLLKVAPHVTSIFEMDLSAITAHRKKHKADFEARGAKLTFTAYFVYASMRALQAVPRVNSRFHDDALELFSDINIGVGTALADKGLIVPVIHRTQELNLFGIASRLTQLTEKARNGQLASGDVQHGTFTISNHGVSGSLIATPIIINQPQSAILGIGKAEKRIKVVEVDGVDSIQIKPMAYVTLSIDHRALDAFQTNAWLTHFVETIDHWDPNAQ